MKDIQKNLLSAFESSGLTYDELAKRTNLPKSALYRYLNGDTEKIPIDRFQAVCAELHVDAGTLLGWKEVPPANDTVEVKSDDIRLLVRGLNKLTPEQVEQAKNVFRAMFMQTNPDLFKGDDDHDR